MTTRHNLVFSGADTDNKLNYRVSASSTQQNGVVPNSRYDRVNLVGASRAQVNTWLIADLSMNYSYATNDQPLKGASGANTTQVGVGSPLLGLLLWPQTDNAKDYLTPAGTRRRLTLLVSVGLAEVSLRGAGAV